MSRDVVTLGRNDVLTAADDLMTENVVRHMPVLNEDGRLVGIVSQRDLLVNALVRALGYGSVAGKKAKEGLLVKEVMTVEVVTASAVWGRCGSLGAALCRRVGRGPSSAAAE